MEHDVGARTGNEELARRASERPGGVAAAVVVWQRAPGGDAVARLRIADGERLGWLDVRVPQTPLPHGQAIERWVERLAESLPAHDRLDELERRSPLAWRAGD